MSLINCPECGKEISDKAKMCPNCGYQNENVKKNYYEKFASYICDNCGEGLDIHDTDIRNEYFCPKCNSQMYYLMSSIVDQNTGKQIETYFDESRNIGYRALESNTKSSITCPYCSSFNTKKISGLSKVGSVAMWGIFSQKVRKQWHCNNCGSDF